VTHDVLHPADRNRRRCSDRNTTGDTDRPFGQPQNVSYVLVRVTTKKEENFSIKAVDLAETKA